MIASPTIEAPRGSNFIKDNRPRTAEQDSNSSSRGGTHTYTLLAMMVVAITPPLLFGYGLFRRSPSNLSVFDAGMIIGMLFLVYVFVGASLFRIERIEAEQCAAFLVFSLTSLITLLLGFAFVFRQFGIFDGEHHRIHDPFVCIYFSVITWTTVGYGDFTPSPETRSCAALEALLGYVFMALLISGSLHLLSRFRADSRKA
jgi:hypothetical protein